MKERNSHLTSKSGEQIVRHMQLRFNRKLDQEAKEKERNNIRLEAEMNCEIRLKELEQDRMERNLERVQTQKEVKFHQKEQPECCTMVLRWLEEVKLIREIQELMENR